MAVDSLREEVKNRVKEAADIVQVIGEVVELKKAGSRFTGLCPFHAEKTPSFSVNPQGQFFHCFGCGESGDVFSFVMKYNRQTFPEALKDLARRFHVDLPEPKLSDADRERIRQRDLLFRVNREAAGMYRECLLTAPHAGHARRYLARRGVTEEVIREFALGYAPGPSAAGWSFVTDRLQKLGLPLAAVEKAGLAVKKDRGGYYDRFRDRILFPIVNLSGQVVAFGGRILGEGRPKYMNSPESPVFDKSRLLFGLYQHRETIRRERRALVVEGNFDLILLAVHGIRNVVAPLGTALTREHIRSLRGYCDEVVLLFDGDSAGLKAAMRAVPFFLAEQVDARVAVLPEGHDPDSYVRAEGAEAVAGLVAGASHLAEFVFTALSRQHGLTLDGKNRIIAELREIIGTGVDSVQRSLMAAHFSEMLGVPAGQLEENPGVAAKRVPDRRPAGTDLRKLPRKQRQLLDFSILYPECFPDLLAAGIEKVITDPAVKSIFQVLVRMSHDTTFAPDRLLAELPEGSPERQYVAELLILGGACFCDAEGEQVAGMRDELLLWLQSEMNRKDGATLQKRIMKAQSAGDDELLMRLLAEKQAMGKKK
jgi:DNA primase